MSWTSVALFAGGILLTGYIALGWIPDILFAITREQGVQRGYAEGVLVWGVATWSFGSLIHRLRTAGPTFPPFWVGVGDGLDAFARGWGLGVVVLSARVIGDGLRSFGAPPRDGSYLADAFFFAVVTLIFSVPGLFAAVMAKRVR
jgi:hypothetical protein